MPPIDEPAPSGRTAHSREGRRAKAPASAADLITFTVDAASGRIVSIARLDDAGARQALSQEDRDRLARQDAGATLQNLIEQAFEAGVDCVLGEGEAAETDDDAELSRLLLKSLIARSPIQPLLQGEALRRAIVATLIEDAANGRGGPPEGAVAH